MFDSKTSVLLQGTKVVFYNTIIYVINERKSYSILFLLFVNIVSNHRITAKDYYNKREKIRGKNRC